ncbi:MAG: recombination protein RecR [Clostridia bacterium]|nr:recombination protein RecR [Clostridia bacterium]MBO5298952.1 recombination protein RecR [Clostridia bacterium]MBQ2720677.1 recombination protein RecR [Clostridia bacterium]MBQ3100060.1 recombination protein RecR [Clostridia bacterium]
MSKIVSLDILTDCFRRLPGIGSKMAARLAIHVLRMPDAKVEEFANALLNAKKKIHNCPICKNLTDGEICSVCSDVKRDKSIICVVETPTDVMAIDKAKDYKGLFHVLHGVISPMEGIGPNDIYIKELIARLEDGEVKEVILATNPTVEGDTTALYISRLIKPLGVKVSRLAFGIPIGGDLEYTDEMTLSLAIENRRDL